MNVLVADRSLHDQVNVTIDNPAQLVAQTTEVLKRIRLARNEADQEIDVTVSVEPSLHHRTKHGQFRDAVPFRGATDRVSVDAHGDSHIPQCRTG